MAIASLLKTLGGRRSIENPATSLADPANWLIDAAGGGRSAAGTSVTRATALTHAAVWRAVNLVAGDIGTMPVHVMRREGAGKVRDTKHAAYRLLRYQACAEVSSGVLREVLQGHVLLEGNGYAYIYRDGAGRPLEIVPLAPHSITPVRYQGELRYIYRATGADAVKLLPENVIHIKGYSEDGLVGYSVLAKAKESLGLGLGAREYGARFLSNNARPAMVLEHPGTLSDESANRLKQDWDRLHQGLSQAHRTAILEEGMKASVIGSNPNEAQWLETREFDLREVANWFGVPPHRLGDATRTSYNSLEQENLSYLTGTLMRWVTRWEGEFWAKLLTEDEKASDSHVVTFLRQSLVQADMSARNTAYKTALAGMPYMTIDEVRAREDLNPLPDGTGAKLLVPANIGSKGGASEPEPPSRTTGDPEAARAVLTETVRRFVRRLHGQVERALRRPGGLGKWVEKLEREELAACHGMLDDAIRAVAADADVGAVVGLIFQAVRAAMAGNDTGALADLEVTLPERVLASLAAEEGSDAVSQ